MEGFLGAALIIGLFVAYALQRRAANQPPTVAPPTPVDVASVQSDADSNPAPAGRSPNWGAPILFVALLAAAATHRDSFWGVLWQVLYFALVTVAAYTTFSPSEFAGELKRDPQLTRAQHYVRYGVPYLLVPVAAWALAIPFGWTPAVLLPSAPWLLLLILAVPAILSANSRRH